MRAEKESCEGDITVQEVEKIKKAMMKNKSAGIDGIPAEFWQKFGFTDGWLAEVFNAAVQRGKMTDSKDGSGEIDIQKDERNLMSNYRPISLLCTDYKLLAKIVTERMKPVLNSVIEMDQQGFIQGGDITGNLILVKEIIEYCNESNTEGAMLMMDFKKAYDRVNRETMMRTLETMNFGEGFRRIVKTLYTEVGARVEVNGQMTAEIMTGGGVRQGCPLSPYLFICVLELMAIEIRKREDVKGIIEPISGRETKISLFADDAMIFLSKPKEQTINAREGMRKYENVSASQIHDGKTMVMAIGATRQQNLTKEQLGVKFKILKDQDIERHLGDLIGNVEKKTGSRRRWKI